jgi:hypothetical protein
LQPFNQSIFLIERLQPSWLPSSPWRWFYTLGSRLVSGLYGGFLVGLVVWPFVARSDALITALSFGLKVGLIGGLGVGLIDTLRFKRGEADKWATAGSTFWRTAANVLVVGLAVAIIVGLITELEAGLLVGLIFGLFFGVRGSQQSLINDIQTVEALNWSWAKAVKGGFQGLIFGLIFGFLYQLMSLLIRGRDFTFDASEIFLWLSATLIFGAFLGLVFGLVSGLSSKIAKTKTRPNQGLILTLRNAFFAGVLFGLSGGLITWLIMGFIFNLTFALIVELGLGNGEFGDLYIPICASRQRIVDMFPPTHR